MGAEHVGAQGAHTSVDRYLLEAITQSTRLLDRICGFETHKTDALRPAGGPNAVR